MSHLPEEHPDAFKCISSGGLSVQLSNSNPFGRVPVDQTCEETVNNDTQTSGGTNGFSLKPNAVNKYYLVIFLFLPMFIVMFIICATCHSNMFVFRSSLLCSLFHPSTICKFCQFVRSKSKSAKVFLAPFRGHNFSPKLTPFCLQTPKRKVARGAFSSSGTPIMLSVVLLRNFHTQP